jgi:hypothetical protein
MISKPQGLCTKCKEDFFNCRCEQFHPNEDESYFTLNRKEVEALREYFLKRAGYISYEFDPIIHDIIKRLN